MELGYYVEMRDQNNSDEWTNKVDIYGYDNEVTVMAIGFTKTFSTTGIENAIECIRDILSKLKEIGFEIINEEDRRIV